MLHPCTGSPEAPLLQVKFFWLQRGSTSLNPGDQKPDLSNSIQQLLTEEGPVNPVLT